MEQLSSELVIKEVIEKENALDLIVHGLEQQLLVIKRKEIMIRECTENLKKKNSSFLK